MCLLQGCDGIFGSWNEAGIVGYFWEYWENVMIDEIYTIHTRYLVYADSENEILFTKLETEDVLAARV